MTVGSAVDRLGPARPGAVPIRVAHVLRSFLPVSETFIYTLIQAQTELEQAVFARRRMNGTRFSFAPLFGDPLGRYRSRAVHMLPRVRRPDDPYRSRLVGRLRRFQPDVLHAHFGWAGVDAVHPAAELSLPLIVAFYGADVYAPDSSVKGMPHSYRRLFATGTLFTCVGPRASEELQALGCPPERVRLIPLGVDLSQFPFEPAKRGRPLILLQVARLVAKKGVDTTIKAYARARSRLGAAELWIVGAGPEHGRLVTLAGQLGVADTVHFWGVLPHESVRELMARAHIGVQPSRVAPNGDREGTPTVILEMQARGLDVATTRHTDIPFIVPLPDRLVPEDDAEALAEELVRLADTDTSERQDRLLAARALVERQHDARRVKDLVRNVYQEALGIGSPATETPSATGRLGA